MSTTPREGMPAYIFDPFEAGYTCKTHRMMGLKSMDAPVRMKGAPGQWRRGTVLWMPKSEAEGRPWFRKPYRHETKRMGL